LGKKTKNQTLLSDGEVPTQIKNPELVQERRRQIVDSTVKLFIEHGYHKTTTRMIAKAANFSIGSLYEYVSSKEDLLYLVCKTINSEVHKAVEEALADETTTGRQRLAQVIRQYFLVCDRMRDHTLLMYHVPQFLPLKWKQRVLENELNITDIFIEVVEQLSGTEGFPALNEKSLNLIAHNISVLGHMWAFRHWYLKKDFTIDDYIKIQTDFILGLVFNAE